jgi:putative transposase
MSTLDFKPFYRRNLPHVQPPGAVLFVTYRLADSLPRHLIQELLDERETAEKRIAALPKAEQKAERYLVHKRLFAKWDRYLDQAASGPLWLRETAVAQIVVNSLHHLDGKQYDLDCFCVMSNHAHTMFQPLPDENGRYFGLRRIMHGLKGYTATEANRVLGRNGRFWQEESYDHVVRDEAELNRIRQYILYNPVKAGLVENPEDWPWSYCKFW